MGRDGRRSARSLEQFYKLLVGADDDKGGHPVVRTVGTVAVLVVLFLIAVETLAGRLIDALGLPHIPIGWLMGIFVAISTIWAGIAAWQKRRAGGPKR